MIHTKWLSHCYVNAYGVTRHWGGPEDGGWWYNAGEPISSLRIQFCDSVKYDEHECEENEACDEFNEYNEASEALVALGKLPDMLRKHIESAAQEMEEELSSLKEGDIYNSQRGVDIEVQVQFNMARSWPTHRPRYE